MALSSETIAIVKSTVPVLRKHGGAIVSEFYPLLFERYPEVRSYFNTDRQKGGRSTEDGLPVQVSALARAIVSYAKHIDNLDQITATVESICHKHVSRGVHASQYSAVGECLLSAIAHVLGPAATPEIMSAWDEAYAQLAELFITIEARLKKELEDRAGWEGFTDMRVEEVEAVEEEEGGCVVRFHPTSVPVPEVGKGQFVAIKVGGEMTSVKIVGADEGLKVWVPNIEEMGFRELASAEVGKVFEVSIPCGKIKA